MTPTIRVQAEPIDVGAELAKFEVTGDDSGAVVSFTGICRSENGRLAALEIEHYPAMAQTAIGQIVDNARARWPLNALTVVHRFGRIVPGETIVLVAAASAHRDAAFEAARFVMDYLKTDAPFWKREHMADGSIGAWVDAKAHDDAARNRWLADTT